MSYRPAFLSLLLIGLLTVGCMEEAPSPEDAPSWAEHEAEAARARLDAGGEGGALVLRAIDAHGGLDAWYAAPTSAYAWEYANVGSDLRFRSYMVVDNRTRRAYHDLQTLGTFDDAPPAEGRFAWTGEDAWISPAAIDQFNPRFWATTGYYFQSIPFVLADPGLRYERLPDADLDGVPHDMVKVGFGEGVGDAPGDTYTLYVNKDTGRIGAIRYTVTYGRDRPAAGAPVRETLFYYEDYTTVDGLTTPTRFRGFTFADGQKGDFRNEATVTEISFRQPFDERRLAMPEGGRIQPPPGG